MSTEAPTLFDPLHRDPPPPAVAPPPATAAAAEAASAIDTAARHADAQWTAQARQLVNEWATSRTDGFSADDVWAEMDTRDVTTHDRRGLGNIFKAAAQAGTIHQTGRTTRSVRRHSAPIPVWIGTSHRSWVTDADDPLARLWRFCTVGNPDRAAIIGEIERLQEAQIQEASNQ